MMRGRAMTEQEWLACEDPVPMLGFLRGKVSDRKINWFKAACCRRIWHLLLDERSRNAVDCVERFAEGEVTRSDLDDAARAASDAHYDILRNLEGAQEL